MLEAGYGNITSKINVSGQFDDQTIECELDKDKKKEYGMRNTQNNKISKIQDDVVASTSKVITVKPFKRFKVIDGGDENTRNESCLVGGFESKVFGIQKFRDSKQKIQKDKFASTISTQNSKSKSLPTTNHALFDEFSGDSVRGFTENGKTLRTNNFSKSKDIQKISLRHSLVMQKVDRSASLRKSLQSTVFKCHLCANVYKSNVSLKSHLKTHSQKHQCEQCGLSCISNHQLMVHYRTHNGEKPYACNFCGKTFSLLCNLTTHIRSHTREKPFVCKLCAKTFSCQSTLNLHNLIHTGEKKYVCSFCPKRFTQRAHLVAHIRTHTGEKPYVCNLCSRAFSCQSNLKTHTLVHSGEKKHTCSFCQNRFTRYAYLVEHIRTHTGERPYGCDKCSKAFSQLPTLNYHKTHLHNI